MELKPQKYPQETVSTFVERMTILATSAIVRTETFQIQIEIDPLQANVLYIMCNTGHMDTKCNTVLALVLFLRAKKETMRKRKMPPK